MRRATTVVALLLLAVAVALSLSACRGGDEADARAEDPATRASPPASVPREAAVPREVVAPRTAALMIRHQMDDACHSWALNEGRYSPSQTVKLAPGGRVTFTNNDTGVHRMVQVGGPMAASVRGPQMIEQGAASALRVRFPKAGTYRFESEHPNPHMGENVLRLRVVVS